MYQFLNQLVAISSIKSLIWSNQDDSYRIKSLNDPDPAAWDSFPNKTLSSPGGFISDSYTVNITVDECITACEAADNGVAIEFWVPNEASVATFNFTTICELYNSTATQDEFFDVPDAVFVNYDNVTTYWKK